jgi:uncharacterized Zn finger protein
MPWSRYAGFRFPPYIPVAERRAGAILEARRLEKTGRKLEPLRLDGKKIAASFWGKAWCQNLEAYSDFRNRLPRGRTYLRNGSVLDLRISEGRVDALVAGSSLYEVSVEIASLQPRRWRGLVAQCRGQIDSVVSLLRGELPEPLLAAIVDRRAGLFPEPDKMRLRCSCPDYAVLCKHVAAVLYGVGARFDRQPETFFTLRSVKLEQLVAKSVAAARRPAPRKAKAAASLEKLFGIELDRSPRSPRKAAK